MHVSIVSFIATRVCATQHAEFNDLANSRRDMASGDAALHERGFASRTRGLSDT